MNTISNNTRKQHALTIGISLLLMAFVAGFSATQTNSVFSFGDITKTAQNLRSNNTTFQLARMGWVIIFVLDLLVSYSVYAYYKTNNQRLSAITSAFRFVYTLFLGSALFALFQISPASSDSSIYQHFLSFQQFWNLGLIFFGFHLLFLGFLFRYSIGKKGFIRLVQGLLITAGIGYILLNTGYFLAPHPIQFTQTVQPFFLIPMIFGEVLFAGWMVIRGGRN